MDLCLSDLFLSGSVGMLTDYRSPEVRGSNPVKGRRFFTAHRKMVGSNLKGSLHS